MTTPRMQIEARTTVTTNLEQIDRSETLIFLLLMKALKKWKSYHLHNVIKDHLGLICFGVTQANSWSSYLVSSSISVKLWN